MLGLFLSFWGKMDVLHPAVFSGWLNAAAIAHEWGFEPYLVPLYSFLSVILIYKYDNIILWYLYINNSKPLYSMHKFWAWAALHHDLPPLKSLVLHDTHLQFCIITKSWQSIVQLISDGRNQDVSISSTDLMLWRDFTGSEPTFSLRKAQNLDLFLLKSVLNFHI